MNMNKRVLSLAVPCFALNFNLRKSKQTLIAFDLWYKVKTEINKLKTSLIEKVN